MKSNPTPSATRRKESYASRPVTKIWLEEVSSENPYVPGRCYAHGYDLIDLIRHASFIEVLFLMIRGELPSVHQAELLEKWWVSSMNPGPRHPATRAVMNAAVSKTNPPHLLPIALMVLGDGPLGATEVKRAMKFIKKNLDRDPLTVAEKLLKKTKPVDEADWHIAPGFGSHFGSTDWVPHQVGNLLSRLKGAQAALNWGAAFAQTLEPHQMGWLDPGIAAAVLTDLGFDEFAALGLFQLSRAPGVLAHGLEMIGQPLTAMPFLEDEDYIIEAEEGLHGSKSKNGDE